MMTNLDCLKLLNFIETSNFFTTNQIREKKILIAFSGGQDSFCLLTVFCILSQKWGFELGAVYCNHCWKDYSQTSLAVFKILEEFNIPFYFVEAPDSKPMKPEQTARIWRYSSFYNILKSEKYDFVLTGHTLSDCAETVLFNLFRGTGLKGVCSLKEYQTFEIIKLNSFVFKKKTFENFSSVPSTFLVKKKLFSIAKKHGVKGPFFLNSSLRTLRPKNTVFWFNSYLRRLEHLYIPLTSLYFLSFLAFSVAPWGQTQNGGRSKLWYTYVEKQRPNYFILKKGLKVRKSLHLRVSIKDWKSHSVVSCEHGAIAFSPGEKVTLLFNKFNKKVRAVVKIAQRFKVKILKKKTPRVKNDNRFRNFFLILNPKEKLNTNLFDVYIKNLKQYQKLDKFSSFITVFKPRLKKDQPFLFNAKIETLLKKKFLVTESNSINKQKLIKIQKPNGKRIGKLNSITNRTTNPIQLKQKNEEFLIFRPFLKINRQTLFLFSKQLELPVHYDKSNKNLTITRNYIRKVIVPLLKKINPRVEENLYKFSRIIEFYYEFVGDLKCPSTRFDIFNP